MLAIPTMSICAGDSARRCSRSCAAIAEAHLRPHLQAVRGARFRARIEQARMPDDRSARRGLLGEHADVDGFRRKCRSTLADTASVALRADSSVQ